MKILSTEVIVASITYKRFLLYRYTLFAQFQKNTDHRLRTDYITTGL